MNDNQEYLHNLRHTSEHVMHQAVKELYPQIHLAMGPATDEGFYNDFDSSPENGEPVVITKDDFAKIEKRMWQLINLNLPITQHEITEKEARELFKGNPYKNEWLDEIVKKGDKITVYWTGNPGEPNSMVDLCRGPHLNSTGEIKAFKLLSVAGAYWHGDEKNKMLTRIYGTAFPTKEELNTFIQQQEQAKQREHRKLGQELELFMFDEEVGQGLPMYLPNGAMIRHLLMNFALDTYLEKGYQLVSTPHIGNEDLWNRSGHLSFYADSMYGPVEIEGKKYRLKPMNCPFHVKMYTSKKRSYRELPVRWTEMGTVYRFEKSGVLHGLTRPRAFTQDDAHIICRPDQLSQEIIDALKLIQYIYQTLGMEKLLYKLSTRDPQNKTKYIGSDENWDQGEATLKEALSAIGQTEYEIDEGGAAFYAPKIDIDAVDAMGRRWQLSTIQVDFNLPNRFNMNYIDENGQEKQPFMIHRALLGSLERFLGVYIEHTGGNFPLWLSPVQVKIIPISEKHTAYATKVTQMLKDKKIRVELDDNQESMQKRIRNSEKQKTPYMLVVGDKEQESNSVAVRARGRKDLGVMSLDEFNKKITEEINKKIIF